MKTYIGLVGEKGSGKETFVHMLTGLLAHKTIGHIKSSDLLAQTLKLWDLSPSRRNLQELAIVLDQGFGKGTVTHGVYERMKNDTSDIVIFDGVRWQTDAEMLRKFDKSILVYITAPLETRYDRTKIRKEKMDESVASIDQFIIEEGIATEIDIPEIAKTADVVIHNDGSLESLQEQVKNFSLRLDL